MLFNSISNQSVPDLADIVQGSRIQGLWRLLRGLRIFYFAAGLGLGLATAARTASFFLIRYFVDTYLVDSSAAVPLWLIVSGFIGLALIQGSFGFLSGSLAAHAAHSVALRLRNFLLDHIQRLPYAYHDEVQTGELVQRVTSDVDAIRRFFASHALESSRILFLFVINFTVILLLNWQLALLSVVIIPFILLISVYFFRRVSKAYEDYQQQEAVLTTTLQENLSGVRVVKAFARQDFEEEKFEKANISKYNKGKRLLLMHSLYWPISDTLCGIQMLAGFAAGALLTINGTLTVGDYLAYAGMLLLIIWPMRNLGRLVVDMSQGMVSFERISEIIREPREVMTDKDFVAPAYLQGDVLFNQVAFTYGTPAPLSNLPAIAAEIPPVSGSTAKSSQSKPSNGAGDGHVEAHNAHSETTVAQAAQHGLGSAEPSTDAGIPKLPATPHATRKGVMSHRNSNNDGKEQARHQTVALQDITFHIQPGKKVALMGAAGAGKSTLVNLLPRFYDYTGGQILLDGRELKSYPREYLRQQVGIVEQEPFLFSRTVRDNITYSVGREVSQAELEDAAKAAAIHDVIMRKLPQGYDTLIGERGTTLSGGQKQRVAIARTLLKDPRILILDDSTSAVDTETEALIRQALERLMEGRTTFIIAHRIQSVMAADLILVLERGRIIQSGAHDELLQQEGMYRHIFTAQTRIEDELNKELVRVRTS
jgi:ABC-type multidrug transport system fused ATPase/permease subunit